MQNFITFLQQILTDVVNISTVILEFFGVIILVYTAIRCFYQWIHQDYHVRLNLAQGIALSLEFKLGSEVLRTVVVRQWSELGILGAIIALRGILTFLIHWEIKNEKKDLEELKS